MTASEVPLYTVVNTISRFLSLMPLRVLSWFSHVLAFLTFHVFRIRRKLILKNLDIAFGDEKTDEEKKRIAYLSIYHFCLTFFEFLHFRDGNIGDFVTIEGEEHVREALAHDQGSYMISLHMGNWEAMGSAVGRRLAPLKVTMKKVGSKGLNRFVTELRNKNKFENTPRQKRGDAYRQLMEALDNKYFAGFVLDHARPGSPLLPFFGKPAKTNTSFAAIWLKRKAPVVFGYTYREGVGKNMVRILPPVTLKDTGDSEKDIVDNTLHINAMIEEAIRQKPEQYFWMHNRWKI